MVSRLMVSVVTAYNNNAVYRISLFMCSACRLVRRYEKRFPVLDKTMPKTISFAYIHTQHTDRIVSVSSVSFSFRDAWRQ